MKIGPNSATGPAGSTGTSAGATGSAASSRTGAQATASTSAATASSSSTVQLSEISARLSGVDAASAASSPFDSRKVQDIKAAISDGRFKVNASVVADKLIASVQDMLGQRGRQA